MPTTQSTAASNYTEPTNLTPGTPPQVLQSPLEEEDRGGTVNQQDLVLVEHEVARETTQLPGLRICSAATGNVAQMELTSASPSTELEEMRA
jgi:hypothetical protein